MLSDTAEYAMRVVVFLASRQPMSATAETIGEASGVPETYINRVFQPLRRAKIVASRRGTGGGYTLVADPGTLTLLKVVNVVSGDICRVHACPLTIEPPCDELCPLHEVLDDAYHYVERALNRTVADIVRLVESGKSGRCKFPHKA